jgi:subtilase family serine protease
MTIPGSATRLLPVTAAIGLLLSGTLVGCSTASSSSTDLLLPVAIGLQRDHAGLDKWLQQAANPDSSQFLETLTADAVAEKFGAQPDAAAAVLQTLQAQGFVGELDPSGSILIGTMPATSAESFFRVKIRQTEENGVTYVSPAEAPKIPEEFKGVVTEVIGLARTLSRTDSSPSPTSTPDVAAAQCPGLSKAASRVQRIYGADAMRSSGIDGSGVTMAILEVADVPSMSIEAAEACAGLTIPPVTSTRVATAQDGHLIAASTEPILDILAAAAMAPGLKEIRSYEFDPYSSIAFPLAGVVADALQPDGPDILSASIGVCESGQDPSTLAVAEWLLAVGSAGGLTTVASTGDTGSSACVPSNKSESMLYPASSTYATAIGGTSMAVGSSNGQEQVVWNAAGSAGGGAQTSNLPRPWYQQSVPGPDNRIVPDVSSIAAPSQFPLIPFCEASTCQMQRVGGTSAGAPTVAGGLALILQQLRQQREDQALRLGLVNPFLYALAPTEAAGPSAVFGDVTAGNNDLYAVGCCQATAGYDAASGLGWVNFGALARAYSKGT